MEESVSRADNLGTRITLQIWTEGEIGAYGCEDRVLVLGRSVASSSSPAQRGRATHGHIPTVVIPQQIRFLHCSAHSSTQSINQSVSTRSRKFRQQSPKPPGSVRPNANLLAHLNPPRSSPKPTTTIQVAKSIPLRPFLFQFGLNLSKNQLIPTNYAPSFRHHQILVPHTTYLTSPSPPLPLLQQPATLRAGYEGVLIRGGL